MLRLLLFLISLSASAKPVILIPPPGFQDRIWQQAEIMHLQTQQQLQAQDQYRRQLLLQDQQRQLEQLEHQQNEIEYRQRSSTMHQYSDRLRLYSRPVKGGPEAVKKKQR